MATNKYNRYRVTVENESTGEVLDTFLLVHFAEDTTDLDPDPEGGVYGDYEQYGGNKFCDGDIAERVLLPIHEAEGIREKDRKTFLGG